MPALASHDGFEKTLNVLAANLIWHSHDCRGLNMEKRLSSTWTPVMRWLGPTCAAIVLGTPAFLIESIPLPWRVVWAVGAFGLWAVLVIAGRSLVDIFLVDGKLMIRGPAGQDEVDAAQISTVTMDTMSIQIFLALTVVVDLRSPCKYGKSLRFAPPPKLPPRKKQNQHPPIYIGEIKP